MPTTLSADPLEILLKHNHWANRRILDYCAALTSEQFHQRFDIGPGTLHDTMTHVVACVLRWADRIDARPMRPSIELPNGSTWSFFGPPSQGPRPPVPRRAIAQLSAINDDSTADLAKVITRCRQHGLGSTFVLPFGTKSYTFSYAAALTHVLTHGVHHRAQCMNMLKLLHAPAFANEVPEIGVVDWQAEGEATPPAMPIRFTTASDAKKEDLK